MTLSISHKPDCADWPLLRRRGTAARIFHAVAEAGGNIRMISQSVSEAGISIAIARKELESVRAGLEGALIRPRFVRSIHVEEDVAIVALIGEAMRGTPGVSSRVFRAVADAGINVVSLRALCP